MSRLLKEPETDTYAGRFAARLRELRLATGMSPEDAAAAIGVTVGTIYHWERGHSSPKLDMLDLLAAAYGLKSPRLILPEK